MEKKEIGVRTVSQEQWDIITKKYDILHTSKWTSHKENTIVFFEEKSYCRKKYAERRPSVYELISFEEWEERYNKWVPEVGDWVVITQNGYIHYGIGQLESVYNESYFNFTNSKGDRSQFNSYQFRKALPHEISQSKEPKVGEYYFFEEDLYVIDRVEKTHIKITGLSKGSEVKNHKYDLRHFCGGKDDCGKWRKALPHEIPTHIHIESKPEELKIGDWVIVTKDRRDGKKTEADGRLGKLIGAKHLTNWSLKSEYYNYEVRIETDELIDGGDWIVYDVRKALPHEIPSKTKPLSVQGGESIAYESSCTILMHKNRPTSISANILVDYNKNIVVPIIPKKQKRILDINTKY